MFLPAQGNALGCEAISVILRPNGPMVLRNDWPVGPKIVYRSPVPQGVALGWENKCPFGAISSWKMDALQLQQSDSYGTKTARKIIPAAKGEKFCLLRKAMEEASREGIS
jgi:hypothetical protein